MKKQALSLIGLIVVIFVVLFVILIVMPVLNKVRKISSKVVCGTNLKGFGNAVTVYGNDFDGMYPCQGKKFDHTWGDLTDDWMDPKKDWSKEGGITVGASMYLLVRLADVSPKSFVCPESDQPEFSGRNPQNLDIVELWDFGDFREGEGPARCVSYSYHQPYDPAGPKTGKAGRFRADDTRSAAFAVMADRNPWYDPKLPKAGMEFDLKKFEKWISPIFDHWNNPPTDTRGGSERQKIMVANAQPHTRAGQNVMFADGHASFEKT